MTQYGDILMQNGCGGWLRFSCPRQVCIARTLADIPPLLDTLDSAIRANQAVAGVMAYEAASGIDAALSTHAQHAAPAADVPLAWFGVYDTPRILNQLPKPDAVPGQLDVKAAVREPDYADALARIKAYIVAGDTYQVNYTIRLEGDYTGDPYALFYRLHASQQSGNAAYVDLGKIAICSASPELFFEIDGDRIRSRPMKGTAPRGVTPVDDDACARRLQGCSKNQAENVMIVDMIRNDLGRIADAGTVTVTRLFDVERYPTVLQMTSTVEATTSASLGAVLRALFPCASITGAPKVRTMQIIRELEQAPRGIYTGTIGYWLPERQARFNVAIRTAVINRRNARLRYGVGGGIVWDSIAQSEWDECLTKAEVLNADGRPFEILETLLWERSNGFWLLERHLARARRSAAYFGYAFEPDAMRRVLEHAVRDAEAARCRVRWLCNRDGIMRAEVTAAPSQEDTLHVSMTPRSCDSNDPFLYHKTTRRGVYDRARRRRPDCDDVLLVNERGEVTESSIANLVVAIDGKRLTPPVSAGLLPGTYRAVLLDQGAIQEAVITPDMVMRAERIWLINSVRGWIDAACDRLVDEKIDFAMGEGGSTSAGLSGGRVCL